MVLFLNWFNHPDLQYEGEKKVLGISSSVDVYTDSFGVPHVFAKNEKDLFFTAGYLAARDLAFMGYKNVKSMIGGFKGWKDQIMRKKKLQ